LYGVFSSHSTGVILVAIGSGVFVGGVAEDELALLSQEIESSGGED